jgi:hypothetical protein
VPELAKLVRLDLVEGILEIDVALVDKPVEFGTVADRREVKGLAGAEDGRVFRKVPILRVVETVCAVLERRAMAWEFHWEA